jgi:hypothetical protein
MEHEKLTLDVSEEEKREMRRRLKKQTSSNTSVTLGGTDTVRK